MAKVKKKKTVKELDNEAYQEYLMRKLKKK